MDVLELAWDTFDFHGEEIARLEAIHALNVKKLKIFKSKQVQPTDIEKNQLLKSILSCCDKLIVSYQKQLTSILDLIKLYDSDIYIPMERQLDGRFLHELANVTATLMEAINDYRFKVKKKLS